MGTFLSRVAKLLFGNRDRENRERSDLQTSPLDSSQTTPSKTGVESVYFPGDATERVGIRSHQRYPETWHRHLVRDHCELLWPPPEISVDERALLDEFHRAGSPLDWAFVYPMAEQTLEMLHRNAVFSGLDMFASRVRDLLEESGSTAWRALEQPCLKNQEALRGRRKDAEAFLLDEFPRLLFPHAEDPRTQDNLVVQANRKFFRDLPKGASAFQWTATQALLAQERPSATGTRRKIWGSVEWTVHLHHTDVLIGLGSCDNGHHLP